MSTASELEYIQLGNFLFSSALAFLYYDHLLTLDDEIQFIWKRAGSTSRYIFLLNRYFAFFGNMVAAYSMFSSSSTPSWKPAKASPSTGILTLRVYALYGGHFLFFACFLAMLVLGTITSITLTIVAGSSAVTLTSQGCRNVASNVNNGATMAIGWEGILLFDMILFAMTLWKAYQNRGSTPYIGNKRVSTFSLLVRDGAVYFLIIASLNLANIISFHIPGRFQGNFSALMGW
ncbi:hypothetical protein F5880DRAFT_1610878 [Lentinula raphanica]|nr:hypothetical protein F5880DRAFT_1610878 [Lentinula raphanica]